MNIGILRKECVDASFGNFLDLLKWVSWKKGNYFEQVDPRGTSQFYLYSDALDTESIHKVMDFLTSQLGFSASALI